MLLHNSDDEERYFNLFRDSTSFKISSSFEDDPFRTIILQACNRDSIRHAVIAIGALDQSTKADEQHGVSSSGRRSSNSNIHHKNAIRQYAQALAIMKKDVAEGRQDLRTTLLTCLVITLVESFHGNYALADAQINNGIELIRTWHSNHAQASAHPMGFSSPAPSIIEDGIVQIFGRLELQKLFWGNTRPTEVHLQHQDAGREVLNNMPTEFSTLYEARIYLELVVRRVNDWHYAMSTTYNQVEAGSHNSPELVPLEWLCVPLSRLPVSINLSAVNMENHQRQRQLHLQDCQSWSASFESFLQRNSRKRDVCGSILLRLAYKAARVIVLTSLVSDLSKIFGPLLIYLQSAKLMLVAGLESATSNMKEVVNLTAQIYSRINNLKPDEVAKFSLDYPPVTPLYFVGLNCRVRSIRHEAIQMMYASLQREGVVGSLFAAKTADWIRHIEEEHMDPVTSEIPEWARVTDVMINMNASARKADLLCKKVEATQFGLVKGEQRTVITWWSCIIKGLALDDGSIGDGAHEWPSLSPEERILNGSVGALDGRWGKNKGIMIRHTCFYTHSTIRSISSRIDTRWDFL